MSTHYCHWPKCGKEVLPRLWGCREHWARLPKFIRDRILYAYRRGQEIDKSPSRAYLVAASAAQKWISLIANFGEEAATRQFKLVIEELGWPDSPSMAFKKALCISKNTGDQK